MIFFTCVSSFLLSVWLLLYSFVDSFLESIDISNEETISTPANTLLIYDKNYPHEYRANETEYKNDWIHIEFDPALLNQCQITLNTPLHISNHYYISDLIQKMAMNSIQTTIIKIK
jgi:hypothetical protein